MRFAPEHSDGRASHPPSHSAFCTATEHAKPTSIATDRSTTGVISGAAERGAQSAAAAEHAKRTSIAADRSTTDVASGTAERGAHTGGHRALSAVLVGVPEPRNYFAYYYSSPPYWATQVFSPHNFAAFILYASQTEPAKAYELATCAMVHHYCGLGSAEPIRWKNDGLRMMFTIPSRRCIADGCRRCSTGSGGYMFRWIGPWTDPAWVVDATPARIEDISEL